MRHSARTQPRTSQGELEVSHRICAFGENVSHLVRPEPDDARSECGLRGSARQPRLVAE